MKSKVKDECKLLKQENKFRKAIELKEQTNSKASPPTPTTAKNGNENNKLAAEEKSHKF